jgi:hypothetical protein
MRILACLLLALSQSAFGACGISSYDVLAQLEQDCRINAILRGDSGNEPQSCQDLDQEISRALPRLSLTATGAASAVALNATRLTDYVRHDINSGYRRAVINASNQLRVNASERALLNHAFLRNPAFNHLPLARQRMILQQIIHRIGVGDDILQDPRTLQNVIAKATDMSKALQLQPGATKIARIANAVAQWSRGPGFTTLERARFAGRIVGKALGALTFVGIWSELTAARDCTTDKDRLTSYFPMSSRCSPSFQIPEHQRRAIVGVVGARPDNFQFELNRSPELCQQYTRFVVYRRGLLAEPPIELPDVNFKCSNGHVSTVSFGESRDAFADMTCASGRNSNIEVSRLPDGNFRLTQDCIKDYDSNVRSPTCSVAKGSQIISPAGRDINGFRVCKFGTNQAPNYSYQQQQNIFETFDKSCQAMGNSWRTMPRLDSGNPSVINAN